MLNGSMSEEKKKVIIIDSITMKRVLFEQFTKNLSRYWLFLGANLHFYDAFF